MNDISKKLWSAMVAAFLIITGVWILVKRPDPLPTTAQSVQPGIVRIGGGYGTIVHPRGYVLTAASLTSQGLTTDTGDVLETVRADSGTGLALLKIMADRSFEPVPIAGGTAESGDLLFTAGNSGLVIGKLIDRSRAGLISVDMKTGLSADGMPLFNKAGELVGICVASSDAKTQAVRAVPVSSAKPLLAMMNKITPTTVNTEQGTARIKWMGAFLAPQSELSGTGLVVADVGRLRAAGNIWRSSGLRVADKITRINNEQITGLLDLEGTVPLLAQNQPFDITVVRNGRETNLTIQPGRDFWSYNLSFLSVVSVLLVFFLIYYCTYRNWIDRTLLFLVGAVGLTGLGYYLQFYDWPQAWEALRTKLDVICFIVGMNILTIILEEGGLFSYLSKRIVLVTRGDRWKIMLSFCLVTYVFSLFVNNLTTIMVLVPMVFKLSTYLDFDPKPYTIAMIIASNLGGASTMVGDFPNMLIGTEAGIAFAGFAKYMMPVCLVQFLLLLTYIRLSHKRLFRGGQGGDELEVLEEMPQLSSFSETDPDDQDSREDLFEKMREQLKQGFRNPRAVTRGLVILVVITAAFLASDLIGVSPAAVALAGGLAALSFSTIEKSTILERLGYRNILFFSSLFVLVGAAEASGVLNLLGEAISHLSFGNTLLRCLILMWLAGLITAFLNAGPSTALFLPLVMSFKAYSPHYLYYWALSLGVLAGSSATLTGATAGTVSSNMLNEFLRGRKSPDAGSLSFREYSKIGIPIALCFLTISSVYIALIYRW